MTISGIYAKQSIGNTVKVGGVVYTIADIKRHPVPGESGYEFTVANDRGQLFTAYGQRVQHNSRLTPDAGNAKVAEASEDDDPRTTAELAEDLAKATKERERIERAAQSPTGALGRVVDAYAVTYKFLGEQRHAEIVLIDGYTTWADIPRIVGTLHGVAASRVQIVSVNQVSQVYTVRAQRPGFAVGTYHIEVPNGDDAVIRHALTERFYGASPDEFNVVEVIGPFDTMAEAQSREAERPYTDAGLDAATGPGPTRAAVHLRKLDTAARRLRAVQNAHTTMNLIGGTYSHRVQESVEILLRMIADGKEGEETYSERTARQYMERERAYQEVTRKALAAQYNGR